MVQVSNLVTKEELRALQKKPHKYKAKKTIVDGIRFDSQKEANKYSELKLLKQAGEIKELTLQPKFVLQPGFTYEGKRYRPITYTADFRIVWANGMTEIIEVKGCKTRDYLIKKKLLLYKYPDIKFTED